MTTIVIRKSSEREYRGFTCMGHAGYARRNQPDIVCAAVSVLVTNTINSLTDLAGEKVNLVTNEETGFVRCDFEDKLQEKSKFLLDSMVLGLETISKDYGSKYVQVKFEEV